MLVTHLVLTVGLIHIENKYELFIILSTIKDRYC